jgi:hypothetical protein
VWDWLQFSIVQFLIHKRTGNELLVCCGFPLAQFYRRSKEMLRTKSGKFALFGAIVVLLVCGGLFWNWKLSHNPANVTQSSLHRQAKKAASPLKPAVDLYNSHKYKQAEAQAARLIKVNNGSTDPKKQRESVDAQYILAFAAARRKDMPLARERFAVLQKEAAKLPDKGKQAAPPGVAPSTLEEDAAYQHAVCTAAMGDKKAAEAEYIKFMQDYPESPLINGALKRIELLHDGHLPQYAEDAWTKANNIAIARQKKREEEMNRRMAQCGPLCLAEFLRRNGENCDADTLAKELKTSSNGTTMEAMADVAAEYGLKCKGLSLTQKGLEKQPLPLITLVIPGHYVIVEKVTNEAVTIWDPYAKGIDKPGRMIIPIKRWKMMWGKVALVFE